MSIREKYLNTLGLSAKASKAEVKKAYRKLSKKYHPDISQDPNATEKFIEIDRAYDFLTNSKQADETDFFQNQYNPPKETEYEKWKRNARERHQQAAHEKALYQLKLTRKINFYSRAFIIPLFLFNLILALDWFLPKVANEQSIIATSQVYERSKRSSYYSYDKISFEHVSILVKKGGAAKASKFNTGIITTTRILGLPRYCQFSADKAITLQHILGVYDTFWILIPTVIILSLYFFKPKISAGNKLSVSCILFFIFFFQTYIFFATA